MTRSLFASLGKEAPIHTRSPKSGETAIVGLPRFAQRSRPGAQPGVLYHPTTCGKPNWRVNAFLRAVNSLAPRLGPPSTLFGGSPAEGPTAHAHVDFGKT